MSKVLEAVEALSNRIGAVLPYDCDSIHLVHMNSIYSWEAVELHIVRGNFTIKVTLWDSESDGRAWIEEKNDYEPLEEYLIGVIELASIELNKLHYCLLKPKSNEKAIEQNAE